MWTKVVLGVGVGVGLLCGMAAAQPAPAPPLAPVHRLTNEEYEATLRHWRALYPDRFSFEKRGESLEGFPIYLLQITDKKTPNEDKQVCLVTALHSGPERSGTSGTLALTEWLLGDSDEAVETRKRQQVLLMPVIHPASLFHTDRFRNTRGIDPYTGLGRVGKIWDVSKLVLKTPEDAPELMTVLGVMDAFQPEVHADLHGTGMQEYTPEQLQVRRQMYQGQTMMEVTGSAYSNFSLRPWDWRVTETMIAAGQEAGYGSDRFEADGQRLLWGPELAPLGGRLWAGQPLFYTAHYSYAKYHTMILALETGWEESAVARMRGLFRTGNRAWGDERTPGYPVDRMKGFVGAFLTASGRTAAERRQSRVELWNKQSSYSLGLLYPQTDGRVSLVCAVSPEAKKAVQGDLRTLPGRLQPLGVKAERLQTFIDAGPEMKLAMDGMATLPTDEAALQIKTALGFRLRLPYAKAELREVCLNGVPLNESTTDGYEAWSADGFTQLQVHVPVSKTGTQGVYVVTCSYQPPVQRVTGWRPPEAVRTALKSDLADRLPPTFAEVAYGGHFRQTLDFWQASADQVSPLVFYVHGGGWSADDKADVYHRLDLERLLKTGISVASVNYRFIRDAMAAEIHPPVKAPLEDAARALQFIRSRAGEWKIDPARIAGAGVSAGGCSVLWLAMRDDMADPKSPDAVARQSTRLLVVAGLAPQGTLDPRLLTEWMPNCKYGGHAFGFQKVGMKREEAFAPYLAERDRLLPLIEQYSPLSHLTKDDPPLFLSFPSQKVAPVKGETQADPNHSALLGMMIEENARPLGVDVQLVYPNHPARQDADLEGFLIRSLGGR